MEGSTGADALQSFGGDGGRGPAFGPVVDAEALVGQGRAGWNPRAHSAAGAVGGREEGRAGGRSALTNKGGNGLGEVGEAEADRGVEVETAPADRARFSASMNHESRGTKLRRKIKNIIHLQLSIMAE